MPPYVRRDLLRVVLLLIGAVTVLTGLVQLCAPGPVLRLLSADSPGIGRHLFATVGMFMIVVGGLLVQALLSPAPPWYVLLWTGLQKFGAFALVGIGVVRDLFGAIALLVAFFDLATALLCWLMARRLWHAGTHA
ncbi:hypothetical protein XF35_43250 [Streptomyces platensis subsp. clarensis]|uniref:Integral membrane protein n=1 Tax=Streptomyces showdoensis TaxID=68268 RepID=A0A2P2GJY7_STREW|nr:hypothetical protein VO63_21955 [Streptomyces showdoensis]MCW7991820.1 hypothetical protein [Streptomyces platensis subsp. clarensis]